MNITIATSETHPLYVNFIPQEEIPNFKGTLSLTFAPGKCHHGIVSSIKWERDVTLDLLRLKEEYKTSVLVTLIEAVEFEKLKIKD